MMEIVTCFKKTMAQYGKSDRKTTKISETETETET